MYGASAEVLLKKAGMTMQLKNSRLSLRLQGQQSFHFQERVNLFKAFLNLIFQHSEAEACQIQVSV